MVAEAGSLKRSRHSALKADNKCLGESAPEGVDGEDNFTHKTSMCGRDVEILYHSKGNILSGITVRTTFRQHWPIPICWRATCDQWRAPLGNLQWMSGKKRSEKTRIRGLECLPLDVLENVFRRLELKYLCRSKILSKSSKALTGNESFLRSRGASGEGLFTAINFFIKDKAWQCTGLDLLSTTWRRLPTFSWLPTPDPTLFKEYLVCGNGSLMCANVSKSPHKEDLVVFNLLTGETRHLPSLNYPRNPVLIHILIDPATNAYKVVAAGSSSSSGEENLSRRVEVYDSQTLQWEVAKDIPGPEFGLNEHQTGVCVDGVLYFVAFLEDDGQKGVAAFNVKKGEWLKNKNCSLPCSSYSNILQLVESSGNVYLFSEQEHGGIVEHFIDVLDFFSLNGEEKCQLKTLIRVKKSGGRGLLVYPEYICVPYGKRKLCVFNTIKRDGVVYDIQSGMQCEELEPPPESQRGDNFFSLNPVSFTLQPNFTSKP